MLDKLQWKEQVKAVKRKACAGLASLEQLQHVLPINIKKHHASVTCMAASSIIYTRFKIPTFA